MYRTGRRGTAPDRAGWAVRITGRACGDLTVGCSKMGMPAVVRAGILRDVADDVAERARRWLTARGAFQDTQGRWCDPGQPDCDGEDTDHDRWTDDALIDPGLDLLGRVGLALGLLELLDEYYITLAIRWWLQDGDHDRFTDVVFAAYRRLLEQSREPAAVTYSLWVDWFEDQHTAADAFDRVLGGDLRRLGEAGPPAGVGFLRRAERVLEASGPVPWAPKYDAYLLAATVPELHHSVFRGILTSYHDYFGLLVPGEAITVLDRLTLPPDTEHLVPLRRVLARGKVNQYLDPAAWEHATADQVPTIGTA
jgi:hypothetical protein